MTIKRAAGYLLTFGLFLFSLALSLGAGLYLFHVTDSKGMARLSVVALASLLLATLVGWAVNQERFRKKIILSSSACLLLLVVAGLGWVVRWHFFQPHWDAIFYRASNYGLYPRWEGPYWTEEECLAKAREALRN